MSEMGQPKIWYNSGSLKPKEKKSERASSWGGDGEITCPHCKNRVAFWLDAWNKMKEGVEFYSIAFKPKDKQPITDVKGMTEDLPRSFSGGQTQMPMSPRDESRPAPKAKSGGFTDDEIPF